MVRLDPLDEDMGQTPSQTEDARERGFVRDDEDPDEVNRGRSESMDEEDTGDIADEGSAHRG
jgi:hypothetical protein